MRLSSVGRRTLCSGAVLATLTAATAVRAETLADAIALAYQSNPTLQAQRAQQRALDETYVQSRAGWRPTVSAAGQAYYQRTDFGKEALSTSFGGGIGSTGTGTTIGTGTTTGTGTGTTTGGGSALEPNPGGHFEYNYGYGQITATQPLYTGGKTAAEVRAAEATVMAGRQSLRATETTILQNVITAYEDVRRDAQILRIRDDNAKVLRDQLTETQAKFDVGQLTRTDTAQAQAQLASAQALLATAKAQLQISRAEYTAVVGQNPGELAPEPALPGLPPTVDEAFDTAEAQSPALVQAQLTEESSRAKIAAARANNRPTVSASASFGADGALVPLGIRDYDRVLTGTITVTQPIFTGGVNSSMIRQAIEQNTSDRIGIEGARRTVVQNVSQAWNTMLGARASVTSNEEGVRAAQVAFEGIREQYRVGLSTTLDVLIQQQTLESAELTLAQARHDEYVAEATLLGAMGRLQAEDLVQGVPLYDPAKSFNKVKHAGAVPWEPLIEAIDTVGEPHVGDPRPIPAPGPPGAPVAMIPADQPIPTAGRLSTTTPTLPAQDTVAPSTPAAVGERTGPSTPEPAPPK